METSGDPFENTGSGDPFEGGSDGLEPNVTDPADEVAAQPPADVPPADAPVAADVPSEEPPIVDKEGEPVAPAAGLPDTMTAAGRAKLAEQGAEGAQEAAGAPEAATAAPEAPATETGTDGGGEQPPADPPAPPATEPPADPPADEGKKGEVRLYKLLYQTGPSQWTEADLKNVGDDLKQYVQKDGDEEFLVARNNDHARRLAFSVLGRPEAGVTVELVARTSWKPKRLSVAPPEPSREKLVIS